MVMTLFQVYSNEWFAQKKWCDSSSAQPHAIYLHCPEEEPCKLDFAL